MVIYMLPYFEQSVVSDQLDTDFKPNSNATPKQQANQRVIRSARMSMLVCPSEVNKAGPNNTNLGRLSYKGNHGRHGIQNQNNDGIFIIKNGIRFAERKDNTRWGILTSDVLDGLSNTAAMSERALGDGVAGTYTPKGDYVIDTSVPDGDSNGGGLWYEGNYRYALYNHTVPPNSKLVKRSDAAGAEGCHPPTSYHPGGVSVMMADGSVRFVRDGVSATVWAAVGGRKDGLTVNGGDL
jgi:prepilin-type processing-associated H-X9-DG protein